MSAPPQFANGEVRARRDGESLGLFHVFGYGDGFLKFPIGLPPRLIQVPLNFDHCSSIGSSRAKVQARAADSKSKPRRVQSRKGIAVNYDDDRTRTAKAANSNWR